MTTVHRAAITVGFAPQPSECADPVNGSFAPEAAIRKSDGMAMSASHPTADMRRLRHYVHALTILPMLAVQDECREGRLAAVRISRPFVKRTIALSFTKQRPPSRAARLVGSRFRTFTTRLLDEV